MRPRASSRRCAGHGSLAVHLQPDLHAGLPAMAEPSILTLMHTYLTTPNCCRCCGPLRALRRRPWSACLRSCCARRCRAKRRVRPHSPSCACCEGWGVAAWYLLPLLVAPACWPCLRRAPAAAVCVPPAAAACVAPPAAPQRSMCRPIASTPLPCCHGRHAAVLPVHFQLLLHQPSGTKL